MTRHYSELGTEFHSTISHVHGSYRAQHVSHGPPDALVDDTVTFRMLVPHLVRAAFFFLAPIVVLGLLWLLGLLVFFIGQRSGGGEVGTAIMLLANVVSLAAFVLAIIMLFLPIKESIAEYSQLVEGRAWAGPAAYYWIARTADEHRIDFGHRANTVRGEPVMFFEHGRLRAMIVMRAYGDHLFMGWTMWRDRSTVVLVWHFLRDAFSRTTPLGETRAEMRATDARGMREVVHSLVREGAQASIMTREMADESGQTPDSIRAYLASLSDLDPHTVDPFRP